MAIILNIETTSNVCSVALSSNGKVINLKEDKEGRSHASKLAVFIQEVLDEEKIQVGDLDAVSISKGPGSYTGLRIGVSTAKGLSFGANIPLLAVHTLQVLTQGLLNEVEKYLIGGLTQNDRLVPLIDARRMEVYSAVLDSENNFMEDIAPVILKENSYKKLLDKHRVLFFGNAINKTREIISHENAVFIEGIDFSAADMVALSEYQLMNKSFEDVAYFEPFYLKDFQTTTPKKKLF